MAHPLMTHDHGNHLLMVKPGTTSATAARLTAELLLMCSAIDQVRTQGSTVTASPAFTALRQSMGESAALLQAHAAAGVAGPAAAQLPGLLGSPSMALQARPDLSRDERARLGLYRAQHDGYTAALNGALMRAETFWAGMSSADSTRATLRAAKTECTAHAALFTAAQRTPAQRAA